MILLVVLYFVLVSASLHPVSTQYTKVKAVVVRTLSVRCLFD